jgi:hypothetical protein
MEKDYNGWSNYETWLVNLWLGEGIIGDLHGVEEQARAFAESGESSAPHRMGEWLKEEVASTLPEAAVGLATDLLGASLSRVGWVEIARHYTDQAIQNEAEQTANANA